MGHFRCAEPQVAPQAARSPWGAGPMRRQCGPRSQGAGVAKVSRLVTIVGAVCSAVRPNVLCTGMLVRLAFGQPVQLGHCCLVRLCAHVEKSTHACSVPRFAVVRRSESVAGVRFRLVFLRDCSSHIRGWARAELGPSFEPYHVSGCFEQAMSHTNRLVVFVFSQSCRFLLSYF